MIFFEFFITKIKNIRSNITNSGNVYFVDHCNLATLTSFEPVSLSDLIDIICHMKRASCLLDPVPSFFIVEVLDTIGPCIQSIINSSLISGSVPSCFKHAVIQTVLKKATLDPLVLTNYRPISKLPFLSKVLEKVVFHQLSSFLKHNDLLDRFQSGFRAQHSTESALLKVLNDLLLAVDPGKCVVLLLLDLSAAFDTIDHTILLKRLEQYVGIRGTALNWFASYLEGRTFSVEIDNITSSSAACTCGVPQGSVLGPLLFSLYLLPLANIFRKHQTLYHCYADDIQLYLPVKADENTSLQPLFDWLGEVKSWMPDNFLQLNDSKTEVLVFGRPDFANTLSNTLAHITNTVGSHARNLGVIFDPALQFDKQINSVVKSEFFQLRMIAKIKYFLSFKDLETVIHAFISSRLDYCNSLYLGVAQSCLSRLQLVQNSAARFLTKTRKRESITPVLIGLHWLPIEYRIQFKILLFVYKSLTGLAPNYLSDLLSHYHTNRPLRSTNALLLSVPKTRLKLNGDRAFSVAAPQLWNNLPLYLRSATSLRVFKSSVKTYLFKKACGLE